MTIKIHPICPCEYGTHLYAPPLFQQYAAESVITAKYQDEVKKKDREIEFLRATMKKQEVKKKLASSLEKQIFCLCF